MDLLLNRRRFIYVIGVINVGGAAINTQHDNDSRQLGKAGRIDGCARIFDGNLMITADDPTRGLTFKLNRQAVVSDFCTRIVQRTDNFSTNRPRNSSFANELTQRILEAGGISGLESKRWSPVISMYEYYLHHAFPKWRYLSQVNRAHYYQQALRHKCRAAGLKPVAFSMRLVPALGRTVIEKNGAGYLLESLSLKLKRSLNRSPEIWLMVETTIRERDPNENGRPKKTVSWSDGLLHVHGAIGLHDSEVNKFKRIVRDLNGSSNSVFLNRELVLKPILDDVDWVNYCNKHRFLNDCFLAGIQRFSRSNSLCATAEELYQNHRTFFKAAVKSKSQMTH